MVSLKKLCIDLECLLIDSSQLIPAGSFVAKNWQHGWMGKFMWGVFTNYLGLEEGDIIAMTSANFSMATNPQNITSVYKGFSTITRCVWEIYLGNVVSLLIVLKTHPSIDSMIDLVVWTSGFVRRRRVGDSRTKRPILIHYCDCCRPIYAHHEPQRKIGGYVLVPREGQSR
jgi:hypothetical protein